MGDQPSGEFDLQRCDVETGAFAYQKDPTARGPAFRLRDVGASAIFQSPEPHLVEVNLVGRGGAPALSGPNLVEILLRHGMPSHPGHSVPDGEQLLPMAGCVQLEPGNVLGRSFRCPI